MERDENIPTRDRDTGSNKGPHITAELPRRLNLNAPSQRDGTAKSSAKTRLEQMLEANLLTDIGFDRCKEGSSQIKDGPLRSDNDNFWQELA